MTALAVVQIEGVLAKVHFELKNARPTADALTIWNVIKGVYKTAVVTAAGDLLEAKHWLHVNGIAGYDRLDGKNHLIAARPEELWLADDMIAVYRSLGWEVGPYITGNPVVAARSLQLGVPTWLIAHPLYMRPEHRPDAPRGPRGWVALVDEIEQQHVMKAGDRRLEAEDVITGGVEPDG